MIFRDQQWKNELATLAKEIEAINLDPASVPADYFAAERPIFYSAFIIRKMVEDNAVTDKMKGKSFSLYSCPSTRNGKELFIEIAVGPLKVEDHFDLDAPTQINMTYSDLASEIIHCDGFVWDVAPPYNLFVFSHRNTLKRLIVVHLPDYLEVIRNVVADEPIRWFVQKNIKTGKISKHAEDKSVKYVTVPGPKPKWAEDL